MSDAFLPIWVTGRVTRRKFLLNAARVLMIQENPLDGGSYLKMTGPTPMYEVSETPEELDGKIHDAMGIVNYNRRVHEMSAERENGRAS